MNNAVKMLGYRLEIGDGGWKMEDERWRMARFLQQSREGLLQRDLLAV
jgi:hypothetical protein